jgi:hypothetical protein
MHRTLEVEGSIPFGSTFLFLIFRRLGTHRVRCPENAITVCGSIPDSPCREEEYLDHIGEFREEMVGECLDVFAGEEA